MGHKINAVIKLSLYIAVSLWSDLSTTLHLSVYDPCILQRFNSKLQVGHALAEPFLLRFSIRALPPPDISDLQRGCSDGFLIIFPLSKNCFVSFLPQVIFFVELVLTFKFQQVPNLIPSSARSSSFLNPLLKRLRHWTSRNGIPITSYYALSIFSVTFARRLSTWFGFLLRRILLSRHSSRQRPEWLQAMESLVYENSPLADYLQGRLYFLMLFWCISELLALRRRREWRKLPCSRDRHPRWYIRLNAGLCPSRGF